MGFQRQEYWNRLPLPSPGDLPNPGVGHKSPVLAGRATREAQSNDAPIFKKLIIQNKKKKKRKVRKSDGREAGRRGEQGAELRADRKDAALPSWLSWQGVTTERLKTQVRPSPAVYRLHGLGEPLRP